MEPYGAFVTMTLRIATRNVWGRYGDWERRQALIEGALVSAAPDVVCLAESWSTTSVTQAAVVAKRLTFDHSIFVGDWVQDGWVSGFGVASRWPIASSEPLPLGREGDDSWAGDALFVTLDGPRGFVQVFVVMLFAPLDGSAV